MAKMVACQTCGGYDLILLVVQVQPLRVKAACRPCKKAVTNQLRLVDENVAIIDQDKLSDN